MCNRQTLFAWSEEDFRLVEDPSMVARLLKPDRLDEALPAAARTCSTEYQ
jgi:hypothetical protein